MKTKDILVVEDEPDIAEFIVYLLSREGYAVQSAANGKEALGILANKPVDLVLTDVMMPVMDGIDLVLAMQRREGLATVPVLVVSAGIVEPLRKAFPTAGAFLQKPFRVELLLAAVRGLLVVDERGSQERYSRSRPPSRRRSRSRS